MKINKREWLVDHGYLSFSVDQGVAVKTFWCAKYYKLYLRVHCNGEYTGVEKMYDKVMMRLFDICQDR